MSRPLRFELAGGIYHITSRGDRCEAIYLDDSDREQWLALFSQVCQRYRWRCHAYCLMGNHYHVMVETLKPTLSKGMRQLNGVYTQYFNRTHRRVGHVFQGRYKAILVERNSYLLELSCYVVLNPVREQMVEVVSQWLWSSYRSMVGEAGVPEWLETDWALSQFGVQRRRATAKYKDYIREGVGQPRLWSELRQQIYLGGEQFIKRMQKRLDGCVDLSEISLTQRLSRANPLQYYEKQYKNK